MANLAYRNAAGRRRGGGVGGPRRPALLCEISRRGCYLRLREGCCHPVHDVVATSATLEFVQLLQEVIFLQAPDDRSGGTFGYAVRAVACVADQELGPKDGLGLSGISHRGHRRHFRDMSRRVRGLLGGICRRGQRGENNQNAQTSRKMIVDHVCAAIVRGPWSPDATNALDQ